MTNSDTIESLIVEYQEFNKKHGLSLGSADEHLFDESLKKEQLEWLRKFCNRWDAIAPCISTTDLRGAAA